MSTLIESINQIAEIKKDLNQVLRDNGVEGGQVFTDYPDKFRELFRVLTTLTDATATGYKAPETSVITVVPEPTLSQYQNIVYVTNNLKEATIYYYVYTDSGKNNIGVTALEKGTTIIVSEPSTVYVYAQYRAERSKTVSIYVPWSAEIVPDPPVITRSGTTVTISKTDPDDVIYYSTGGEYQIYTGAITVARTEDVMAFTQNYRGRSDTVIDEAPDKPAAPAVPTISCSLNVVTISCATTGATIYYKRTTDQYFIEYTSSFRISQSGFYIAKSMKDGVYSEESDAVWCEYLEAPAEPSFNVTDNTVYITCPTNGATIYYKIGDGQYQPYTGPITLTETVTISAYAEKNGIESDTVTQTCTYVEPVTPTVPADPTISCSNNIVTIACSTSDATIYYSTNNTDWLVYSGPFEIASTVTIYSFAQNSAGRSNTVSQVCTYVEPSVPEVPEVPVFACSNNQVSLTCSTLNATIWYRNVNDSTYTQYTGPFSISQTGTYVAYAEKNGQISAETAPFTATYDGQIVVPADPVITAVNNEVTITCATSGASIIYRINDGSWYVYDNPIMINSNVTIYAYSNLNGYNSNTVSKEVVYVDPSEMTFYDGEDTNPDSSYNNMPLGFQMLESGTLEYIYTLNISNYNAGSYGYAYRLEYKIDSGEWTQLNISDSTHTPTTSGNNPAYYYMKWTFELNSGSTISFRSQMDSGIKNTGSVLGYGNRFKSNARCNVFGNIYSLCFKTLYPQKIEYTFVSNGYVWGNSAPNYLGGFARLFQESMVVDASNLILPVRCSSLYCMFKDCIALTNTPKMSHLSRMSSSVTGLYTNFEYMFENCTSLTYIPLISSSCYYVEATSMFAGCISLNYNYNVKWRNRVWDMFNGCISMKYIKISSPGGTSPAPSGGVAVESGSQKQKRLLRGIGGSGVVVVPSSYNITPEDLEMPENWSIVFTS